MQLKASSRSKPQTLQRRRAKPRAQASTLDVAAELALDETRITPAAFATQRGLGQLGLQVLAHDVVKRGLVRLTGTILRWQRRAGRAEVLLEGSTLNETSDTLPDVAADADQLQQVLVNLVMNACDACEPGGRVTIRGRLEDGPTPAGSRRVRIEVDDDGCGIPEENRNQVFDPFFTTKKRGAGSGLGLSIVAQIVRNHQGEIELESEPGRGTCVTLLWPTASSTAALEEDHGDATQA